MRDSSCCSNSAAEGASGAGAAAGPPAGPPAGAAVVAEEESPGMCGGWSCEDVGDGGWVGSGFTSEVAAEDGVADVAVGVVAVVAVALSALGGARDGALVVVGWSEATLDAGPLASADRAP